MSVDTELEQDLQHDTPTQGVQILWGRILVLLLALALAFWLGTTFGGDSAALQRIEEQQSEIGMLEAQVAAMEAELAAVDAGGGRTGAAEDVTEAQEAPTRAAGGTTATGRNNDGTANGTGGRGQNSNANGTTGRQGGGQDRAQRYVIQSGDSLASIAQEVYGDPTRWRDIARANDIVDPLTVIPGTVIRLPALR